MVSNQGWSDDRLQPRQRGTHTIKEVDIVERQDGPIDEVNG
jgi:hypothetical protein